MQIQYYIDQFMTIPLTMFVLIVVWCLGGTLFSDIIEVKRDKELSIGDKLYFHVMWPFMVLITILKT